MMILWLKQNFGIESFYLQEADRFAVQFLRRTSLKLPPCLWRGNKHMVH